MHVVFQYFTDRNESKAKNEISCIYFSLTSRLIRRVLIMRWGWSFYRMIHTLSGDMECVNVLCAIWIYTRVLCCWFAPKVDPHSSWHKMDLSGPNRTVPWLLIFLIHAAIMALTVPDKWGVDGEGSYLIGPWEIWINFYVVIFIQILVIDGWGIFCEITLLWMTLIFIDDQSTLVQVMASCRHATSHYLSQCWTRSLSPFAVTMPQCLIDRATSVYRMVKCQIYLCSLRYIHIQYNMMNTSSISTILHCIACAD